MEVARQKPKAKKKQKVATASTVQENVDPIPEAPKDIDVAKELFQAALESSEELTTITEAEEKEEEKPQTQTNTDTYNKLVNENKKILCELTHLNLNEATTSAKTPKLITAFTEEQLAGLYHNAELGLVDDFTAHFVEAELKGVGSKQHPLYELLTNYLHVREKITGNTLEFNQLREEYKECRGQLWTMERAAVTKQGQCQDGVRVTARHEYDKAAFHRSAFQTLVRILGSVQNLTNKKNVLFTFSAEDLKLQIELYLQTVISNCMTVTQVHQKSPVSLTMEIEPPAHIKPYLSELRLCISVLFSFQRCLIRDAQFVKETRDWLGRLVAILLRVANFQDHLFLLNHILRCPPGVGTWAASYIQTPFNRIESPFASYQLNHVVAALVTILTPINKRDEFLESFSQTKDNATDALWVIVDSDGEEDEETSGTSLKENDLVALMNQLRLDDVFRATLLVQKRNYKDHYDRTQITESHVLRFFAFATVLLRIFHKGLKTYQQPRYNQFAKRLSRFIRHVVQYATDQWEIFKEHRTLVDDAMLARLQVEYDAFFLRATYYLYSSQKLGAWQFLAVIPYHIVSKRTLWKLYYFLHDSDGSAENILVSPECENYAVKLWEGGMRSQFEEKLETQSDVETYYLLNTFANMALARESVDMDFIEAATVDLLQVGFISELTKETCCKTARILLTHITSKHPHLLSRILTLVKDNITQITTTALYLYAELPLTIWTLQDDDFKIISSLLLDHPIDSDESRLARMIISRLNWDLIDEGRLFLPYRLHVQMALLVAEAVQKEAGYMQWAWQTVLRLRLHFSDRGLSGFEEVKDIACYDLISRGVREQQLLAVFLSILMTSWGHLIPLIHKNGLAQLQFLQTQLRHESVIFALNLIVPLFIDSQEVLINSEQFQNIINNLINADRTYINMAKSLVVSQNTFLEQFGHMIENHLVNHKWYNLQSPRCLVRLWTNTIISLPNWNKDSSVLYLLDVITRAAFFHADAFEAVSLIFKDLLQIATPTDSGSVISLFKWVAQGNQGRDCLVPVSLAKHSWLAYVMLSVEFEEKESRTGLWREILVQLKNQKTKVNVDAAIKKAASVVKVPAFSSTYLTIYRWAQQAMDAPVDHPLVPLLWQKFFCLFLERIPITGVSDYACVGEKFFDGLINFAFKKKMKRRLQETIDFYRQKGESDESEEDETKKALNEKLLKLFKAYSLWLEEPCLQEINLHLPSLPLQYEPQLLALILHGDRSPWLEYVDYDQIKTEQQANIRAWRISNYREKTKVNQPLPNAGNNMESPDPAERILRRLASYDTPRTPPEIKQVAPVVPRIDFADKETMFKSLESCFAVIHQFAHNHHLRVSEYKSLDCTFQELLPQLYRSVSNKVVKQVPCRNRNETVHCAGAARIVLEMQEARVNERVQHQIEVNRNSYESLLSKSWQAPALALCTASVTIQQAIKLLQTQLHCNPATAELGVELFYHILTLLTEENTSYPPSRTLFAICLEKLGQSHIDGVEFEMPRLLETVLNQPSLGAHLIPHFTPTSAGTANLLLMYATIEQRLCEKRDVNFALLSKFDIERWLVERKPKMVQRSEFINTAIKALTTLGFEPKRELLMLHEVYRKHLLQVFECEFPEHYGEILVALLKFSNGGTDSNCVAISVWLDILNAMARPVQIKLNVSMKDQLRPYAQHQKMLQHQELLDTAVLLARHFTQERLHYGLYGLYPKYRQYMEVFCLLIGMAGHALILSFLNTHQGELGDKLCEKIWPYLRDMFAPWIIPYSTQDVKKTMAHWIQQLADDRAVLLPWIPADGVLAQKVINVLFECIHFITETLPGSSTILNYLWHWYVASFAHKSVKEHILSPIHAALLSLPWQKFWPSLVDLESMFRVIQQNLPDCHVFLGHIFVSIPWQPWIASLNENTPPPTKTRVHVCLLHLLVKLANDPSIRSRHAENMKILLVQAEQLTWSLIEPRVHQQIMDWYVVSCDPGVLFKNDPLNLDVRVLEFLKVVSGYNRFYSNTSELLLEKRRTFLRTYIKLIEMFSNRNKTTLQSKENDFNRILSAQLSHLEATVQEQAELQILLTEFVAVLNFNHLKKINENCFTIWIKNRAGDGAAVKTLLKVLPVACADCDLLAVLLECCISAYFHNRGGNCGEGTWKEVVETLVFYPPRFTELAHALVARACVLTLHAFLEQRALKSTDPVNLMSLALTYLEEIKISNETVESEMALLWFDIVTAAQKSCEIDEAAAATNLQKFAQILLQHAGEKSGNGWGRGFLGAIGIVKQQQISLNFRFLNRALAGYILAQLPEMKGASQIVRQKEHAPSVVGQSGGNTECVKVLLGLEFGQTQGKIKDCAELALKQIQDPSNSLHNAKWFLATLVKQFYSKPFLKDLG